jgi:Protein O-mannosyl-transferase TMEM260-like
MDAVINTATASAEGLLSRRARSLSATLASSRVLDSSLALGIFAFAFTVYNATLASGLTFVSLDGNEAATVPYRLGLMHSPGYPFYTWLGKLFTLLPAGDVAHCMNLMSAVSAAGACVFLYGIVVLLARSRLAALFAALLFAFSPVLWSQAVIAEVYAPNAFMLALAIFLFVAWGERLRRHLGRKEHDANSSRLFWSACLVFGLSLGTHLSNLALIPGLVLYVLFLRRVNALGPRQLAIGGGLFVLAACQFVWLPLRASTLNDELMLRYKPDDLANAYNYIFNVFHEIRFAFSLQELPARLSVYVGLVNDNFGTVGIALALVGMWDMFRRQRAAFCLLAVTYLIEVLYFVEYNVPDISVFFLAAHLIFAIWTAFGVRLLLASASGLAPRRWAARAAVSLAFCAVFAVPPAVQLTGGWSQYDHHDDTTVKDFYDQAFLALPQNSVLLGNRGVPGFDLFHHYVVSASRPDVDVPQFTSPYSIPFSELKDRPLFLTLSPDSAGLHQDLPNGLWFTPVIAGPSEFVSWLGGHPLTLYEAHSSPPAFVVEDARPQHAVDREMDGVRLLGFDIGETSVAPGGTLHLRLYWQIDKAPALDLYKVSLTLGDDRYREIHTLGFGLVKRFREGHLLTSGATIVEDYRLVVMSSLPAGEHPLRLATCDFGALGSRTEGGIDLIDIQVVR